MTVELRIDDPAWTEAIEPIEALAERAASAALNAVGISPKRCSISILLCSDDAIAELNERFRARESATNVLSWPSLNLEKPLSGEADLDAVCAECGEAGEDAVFLGDVALAFGVVQCEAESTFKSLEAHLSHLIVHGVLHLLGYDHEVENEAEAMAALEVAALSAIGMADPYAGGGV